MLQCVDRVPDWSPTARSAPPAFPSNANFLFCCSAQQLTKHMLVRRLSLVPCQVKALDSTFPEVFSSSSSSLVWWYEWFSVTAAAAAAVYRHSLFKGHDAHSKEEENALSTILPD